MSSVRAARMRRRLSALLAPVLLARPAFALHRESPAVIRLTSGGDHAVSTSRSWNYQIVFAADEDILGAGATGRQIYLFDLFNYDCQKGLINPAVLNKALHCPDPPLPYLIQVTTGPGNPDNPSIDFNSDQILFDADGTFDGGTGPAAAHRQIYSVDCILAGHEQNGTDFRACPSGNPVIRRITAGTDGDSRRPATNFGGGAIVFESTASNPSVTGQVVDAHASPPGVPQIWAHVVQTIQAVPEDRMVQITHGAGPSEFPMPHRDGNMLAFQSSADLLGDQHDTGITQIFTARIDRTTLPVGVGLAQVTKGNAPSQHAWIAATAPYLLFDSTATDLPGGSGEPGSHVFSAPLPSPGQTTLPQVKQITTVNPFGQCSSPSIDLDDNRYGFVCTGDPLGNGTAGNRAFVFDTLTNVLSQLTGRGDVRPPIDMHVGHNFMVVADTTDLTGGDACGHQLELIDYFPFPGHWIPASAPGELPPDMAAPAPITPPDTNVLGNQIFDVLAADSASGSHLDWTTSAGTTVVDIDGRGLVPLDIGAVNEAGLAPVTIPARDMILPAVDVPGVGVLCITAAEDGGGAIDCRGGGMTGDLALSEDHNVNATAATDPGCASGCIESDPAPPPACQGRIRGPHAGVCNGAEQPVRTGTSTAGEMQVAIPVKLSLVTAVSPNAMAAPCTDPNDFNTYRFRNVPATLQLSTGAVTTTILDANDTTGASVTSTSAGVDFDCAKLKPIQSESDLHGTVLVGAIPLLDVPVAAGVSDVIVGVQLEAAPEPCLDCVCSPGPCTTDADCSDGNACNGTETCVNHTCLPGTPLVCDDGNVCTTDTCDPAAGCQHADNTLPCDDGSVCTTNDACANGVCTGTAVTCTDGNPCTLDLCDPVQGCVFPDKCNDGNVCNGTETCDPTTLACNPGTPLVCDDGNPCTNDSCDPVLGCVHTPNTLACDDGNPCTVGDTCANGACVGTPVQCSDGNACNGLETCDSASGACVAGPPPNCDDGNVCTDDSCVPATGCLHVANTLPCDDGNACTNADTCANGVCTGVPFVVCSDGNPCNGLETCNPADGTCLPGTPPSCDDGNVCTDDACTDFVGCVHTPNTAPCDDGNRCTTGDTCSGGACAGTPVQCSDGNACDGVETCDPTTGMCVAGAAPNCDDGNVCTDDSCDPATGCVHVNNTSPCSDGNGCTVQDTCSNGQCVGQPLVCSDGNVCNGVETCDATTSTCLPGTPLDCNDGDPCTADSCDPILGCLHPFVLDLGTCRLRVVDALLSGLAQDVQLSPADDFASPKVEQQLLTQLQTLDRKTRTGEALVGRRQLRLVRVLKGKTRTLIARVDRRARTKAIQPTLAQPLAAGLGRVVTDLAGLVKALQ